MLRCTRVLHRCGAVKLQRGLAALTRKNKQQGATIYSWKREFEGQRWKAQLGMRPKAHQLVWCVRMSARSSLCVNVFVSRCRVGGRCWAVGVRTNIQTNIPNSDVICAAAEKLRWSIVTLARRRSAEAFIPSSTFSEQNGNDEFDIFIFLCVDLLWSYFNKNTLWFIFCR